ncbi:hypothetical protein HB901_12525 [Listeria booriae]|uniref:hypothetical protein n=1 Tax=Listeria booriae TaxID=1552123 RepID=UPI001629E6B5|nr:hypothetical protein [Listeria booriae]MBC1553543.1 hypothetical protein [Listeria booriae]
MNDELIRMINKLQHVKSIDRKKEQLYSLICIFLMRKDFFKLNIDIKPYFDEINLEFREYVYSNKSLIIGRTVKKINEMNDLELNKLESDFIQLINTKLQNYGITEQKEESKLEKKELKNKKNYVRDIVKRYNIGERDE